MWSRKAVLRCWIVTAKAYETCARMPVRFERDRGFLYQKLMSHAGQQLRDATLGGFRVRIFDDSSKLATAARDLIVGEVRRKPDLILVTATGGSPTETYAELAAHHQKDHKLFERLRIHKLDEWGGLDADDPGSCESYLRKHLLGPLQIPSERYFGFRPNPGDPHGECRRVSRWLQEKGPIDICVLGLGLNGHLALNEPADFLTPFSHVAELSAESKSHPMLSIARKHPTYGMGLGIGEILQSRHILLLVNGAAKAQQLRKLLHERRIHPRHPASFLWLHPNVTCLCDAAAAAESDLDELKHL